MKEACVLGRGLIGTAIKRELELQKIPFSEYINNKTDVIFDMRGTTHQAYDTRGESLSYECLTRHYTMTKFCAERGIRYVWPSSALVLEKDTLFARDRREMEKTPGVTTLRLFPVYGNESHKRENASVIYKWTMEMSRGKRPEVWGDGTQGRDFIHSSDVAKQAIRLSDSVGVFNIGTGRLTRFCDIIETINQVLGTRIEPIFVPRPKGYSEGITSPDPVKVTVSLEEGIRRILDQAL